METFLQDCSADIGAEASTHLAEQSRSVTQQSVQSAAWQEVPSTYLVCTQARDTPVQAQREFARRAGAVVDLLVGPAVTGFVTTEELLTAAYGAYKRAGHRWTAGCCRRRQVAWEPVRRLETENEILKRAAAYFARENVLPN